MEYNKLWLPYFKKISLIMLCLLFIPEKPWPRQFHIYGNTEFYAELVTKRLFKYFVLVFLKMKNL